MLSWWVILVEVWMCLILMILFLGCCGLLLLVISCRKWNCVWVLWWVVMKVFLFWWCIIRFLVVSLLMVLCIVFWLILKWLFSLILLGMSLLGFYLLVLRCCMMSVLICWYNGLKVGVGLVIFVFVVCVLMLFELGRIELIILNFIIKFFLVFSKN